MGGGDKTALDLGAGRSVLDHLVSGLDTSVPVVVVGPRRPLERSVRWAREPPPGGGPRRPGSRPGSRRLAPSTARRAEWVVVLAGDQPFAAAGRRPCCSADARTPEVDAVVGVDAAGRDQPLLGGLPRGRPWPGALPARRPRSPAARCARCSTGCRPPGRAARAAPPWTSTTRRAGAGAGAPSRPDVGADACEPAPRRPASTLTRWSPARPGRWPAPRPGRSRCSWVPRVAAATGTPSWAAASAPSGDRLPGQPHRRGGRATAPTPSSSPSPMYDGWCAEVAQVERGAEPDEEQRAEEALGEGEELLGQPARLTDRGDGQPEGEAGQHDRHVRGHGERGRARTGRPGWIRSSSANASASETRCSPRPDARCAPAGAGRRKVLRHRRIRPARRALPASACRGSMASGRATMQAASAIATCGSELQDRPARSGCSESTIGRTSAADDEAISTA